jgi:Zn/Cd-binding protein ZinT
MKAKKMMVIALCVVNMTAFAVAAFAEEGILEGWQGEWVSSYALNSDPAMEPAFAAIADAVEGKTAADVKALLASMYKSDFGAMDLKGDTVTYYGVDGKTVIATCEYQSKGKEGTVFKDKEGNESEFFWYMFSLKSGDDACDGYKNLIATEVHAHEGGLEHWHMRYGSMDLEKLMNHPNPMWWPTLLRAETTVEQALENTMNNIEAFASMF